MQTAAVETMSRLGAKLPDPASGMDLVLLLAQYRPASTAPAESAEPDANQNVILVALPATASAADADAIAREHRLVLIDSTELSALGLRIVRYRIGDGRSAAALIAVLLRDPRVEQAQVSATYTIPVQPPAVAAQPAPQAPKTVKAAPRAAPRATGRGTAPTKVARSSVPAASPDLAASADRIIDVGDVVAGGL